MKFSAWYCSALVILPLLNFQQAQDASQKTQKQGAAYSVLEWVPSDTPYLFAVTEPLPKGMSDKVLDWMKGAVELAQENMPDSDDDSSGPSRRNSWIRTAPKKGKSFSKALFDVFAKDFSRAGLAKVGLTVDARFVVYGIGLLPALRLELKDPKLFKEAISRVEQECQIAFPKKKFNGQEYWTIEDLGETAVVGVVENEIVATMGPKKAVEKMLPLLFAQQKPNQSLAESGKLKRIQEENRFLPSGFGYVDFRLIGDFMTGEAKGIHGDICSAMDLQVASISGSCKSELKGFLDNIPELLFGYEEFSETAMQMSFVLSMKPELAKELVGLRSLGAGLRSNLSEGYLLSAGAGLDLGKTIEFFKNKLSKVQAQPYRCEWLSWMNEAGKSCQGGLSMPMPPFLAAAKSIQIHVKDIPANFVGPGLRACVIAHSAEPKKLFDELKSQIPPLANVELEPNGKPTPLPKEAQNPMVQDAQLGLTENALGFSVGGAMSGDLIRFLNDAGESNPPVLYFSYDISKLMEKFAPIMNQAMMMNRGRGSDAYRAGQQWALDMYSNMRWIGCSLYFTEKGIVARSKVVFK